jgi:hypothetical protein
MLGPTFMGMAAEQAVEFFQRDSTSAFGRTNRSA